MLVVQRQVTEDRSPVSANIKFTPKPIARIGGFTHQGIVKNKFGRYGIIHLNKKNVVIKWDDEQKPKAYVSLDVAKNWALIEPVPWFIAGQTVVVIPRPDGTIALPECEHRVVAVDDEWIEIRQLSGDRIDRYPIAELPGFPFRNDVAIKEQPLLPIPPRYSLTLSAGKHYLWDKRTLTDLMGQKKRLYEAFRKEQVNLSDSEEDFTWAWKEEWTRYAKRLAKDFGHGGKKIGTRLYIEGAIETITDFDAESFEFITDKDRRISLLQVYLHPELAIEKLADTFFILRAGEYIEGRIGFNNKDKAKKREVLIKRLSGCKAPTLVVGDFTGCTHEWLLTNSFKKSETFVKRLIDLADKLPK